MSTVQSPPNDAAERPNLDWYRKRAKTLLKEFRSNIPEARQRFRAAQSPVAQSDSVKLADAQFVVARESGFASWTRLKRHVESMVGAQPSRLRPYVREIDWYRDRAEGLVRSYLGHMAGVSALIRSSHPRFATMSDAELAAANFTLDDALLVQARQHGFESWEAFAKHIEKIVGSEEQEPFLLAFEAIKSGDKEKLRRLLEADPTLANAQGSNGNTLLNLAVSFAKTRTHQILLDAGASVNIGNNYGWTPLHQVAGGGSTRLAKKLIEAGGDLTLSARGEGGTPLVLALFWGNTAMADFLAQYDVTPNNLRVAAGLGRLDLLEACFDSSGQLTPEAKASREFYRPHGEFPEWSPSDDAQEILNEAFTYACRNGRTTVLPFLIKNGAAIEGDPYRGTGLIWASFKDNRETVDWLVEHGTDINQQATFGGRNHGLGATALHLAAQDGALERIEYLVELGADPNIPDHLFNATATDWAYFCGNKASGDYLLGLPQAGILNLATHGLTARVEQVLAGNLELVNGVPGENRALPLHRSVENAHFDTARALLEKGADPNLRLHDGRTALEIALKNENRQMVQLLKEFGAE